MQNSEENFIQAQDWFYDRYLACKVEAKRYLLLCVFLTSLLVVTIIAWIILLPLKQTIMEPYVVLIDNVSGITATLSAAKTTDLTEHPAVVRYFLAKYVQAREGYNLATIGPNIEYVRAFSSPDAFSAFQGEWNDTQNQELRMNLGGQGELNAEILSMTFPLPDIVHIRYVLDERRAGNSTNKSTWLSTLKITQVSEMDDKLAILNPLGLVITHYETIRESNHDLHNQTINSNAS